MAKKSSPSTKPAGKALVIVESPAKARTISGYLGKDYIIEASIGHVRDLPEGAKQIPEEFKGEDWAYLGVNVKSQFEPVYIIPPGKTQQVRKLKGLLKEANRLYLATDEDREGEAISWHLRELLKPKVPVHRLVFHEITKEAILEALETPRDINEDLVRAQETRRIVDRLYGYEVSPLLWRKVRPKLSAGRVQSVAVRLIVQRERERMAFVASTYWDLLGHFAKKSGEKFAAELVSVDGKQIPSARDFDSSTGKLKDGTKLLLDEAAAGALAERLKRGSFRVLSVEEKPYTSKPYPPFTTSTLQQEANRKLRYTARRTMQIAQSLYENGHITYMRTDSTNLAKVAIEAARDLVATEYGREYLPGEAREYRTKVKNAQEAHEAIRPAGHPFALPDQMRGRLSDDEFKLFDLIWKRTIASQMADARGRRIIVQVECDGALFQVGGKTIDFAGYLRAYVEGSDDPQAELADQETVLPQLDVGELLNCLELESKDHTTQPPARFTEATLTRSLEEMGIGRPSTYAVIIDTVIERNYVFKKGNALVPTWVAFAVANLLEMHLPSLVDYGFTAQMEDDLDSISRGESGHTAYLRQFYYGNGKAGLKQQLEHKVDAIDAREVSRVRIGAATDPATAAEEPIFVRIGRYGPFLEHGGRRASLPDDVCPDEINVAKALELLEQSAQAEEPLGICPTTNKPVYLKVGRFGPYVQRGAPDEEEKPQNASLMRGMQPADVTLEVALKLLTLPRTLGNHPENTNPILAFNGKFGPYIKCGDETRSLPSGVSPLEVTLEEALALLAQPKTAGRRFGAPRQPLRELGESPVTKAPVQMFHGRYGHYVTDGTTNASLPKDSPPDTLTMPQALELLAARAALGPSKKKAARRGAPQTARAAKKAAPKGDAAAPTKKPVKKKAAKKGAKKKAAPAE